MGIYLNPGNDSFKRALRSRIYVDKSGLIAYANCVMGSEQGYICVSRPRRFGKSMAANMLSAYYSKQCDSRAMFQELKIAEDPSYEEYINQHDVIFLNIQQFMRGAGTPDNLVNYIEMKVLAEIRKAYSCVREEERSLPDALMTIYTKDTNENKGFVFIVDEWDCIFREAKENKNAQKMYLDFLRDLFKDRVYVKLAYMTGILPIKKYGTHSALNIFDEFSMTDPKYLAEYVGFTEEEIKGLCQTYHMDFEEAKRWYDGYYFKREKHIYNPKSIVDAMIQQEFQSYWTSTETYEALKIYMDMNFDGLKDAVITMMGGIGWKIDTTTFQNDMTSFSGKDDVLTLLVHLGYLAYDEEKKEVFIPNEEIQREFLRAVKQSGWNTVIDAVMASEKLLKATLNCDAHAVARGIDAVHAENTSILSYNNENSLSCVITLAYYSAKKDYILIRELPSGNGFADMVFLPRKFSDKPAFIIELKWDYSAKGAISQIKDKQYVKSLEQYSGKLLLVGINYDKKTKKHECVIEPFLKRPLSGGTDDIGLKNL